MQVRNSNTGVVSIIREFIWSLIASNCNSLLKAVGNNVLFALGTAWKTLEIQTLNAY